MSKKRLLQKKIYDNAHDSYVPVYANEAEFKKYMQYHVSRAKKAGQMGTSFKAVMNAQMIKKLELKKGMKVLDAGCGGGILINQLVAMYGVKGYGLDLSHLAIKRAKQAGDKRIIYKNGILEKIPFANNTFDAISSFDVLEHTENKKESIAEIARVLKPGGRVLLYIVSSRDIFTWHWFLRLVTFGKFGKDTEGGHFKELFADPFRIKEFAAAAGLKNVRISYLHSFFTLMLDEILFTIQKARVKKEKGKSTEAGAGSATGSVYNILSLLFPVFQLIELPWKILGLSNGFFITAEKPKR